MQGCFDALFVWIPAIVCASVIERMYDWSLNFHDSRATFATCFSCYWKNVRLKLAWIHVNAPSILFQLLLKECTIEARRGQEPNKQASVVSVVIERMYDWSSETNWLKINDFWQLVSGLFFENGRSAQKVPLFSKIWGDCLTVFDSCGNIWLHSFNNEIALGRAEINLIKY